MGTNLAFPGREELKTVSRRFYERAAQVGERADAAKAAAPDSSSAPAPSAPLTFLTPHSGPTNYDQDLSATRRLESRRRDLADQVADLTADVKEIEARFEIDTRWTPLDARYQSAMKYRATREYQRALGRLQRLVIQRLFELHKLNIAQTGPSSTSLLSSQVADCRSRSSFSQVTRRGPTLRRTCRTAARQYAQLSTRTTKRRLRSIHLVPHSIGARPRTMPFSRSSFSCRTLVTTFERGRGHSLLCASSCVMRSAFFVREKKSAMQIGNFGACRLPFATKRFYSKPY